MKILVINSGSSSIKFKLFQKDKTFDEIASGYIDAIGKSHSSFIFKSKNLSEETKSKTKNLKEAQFKILEKLTKEKIITGYQEIEIVGHRIVHGGEKFLKPTLITSKTIKEIEKVSPLAPLHNYANLLSLSIAQKIFKTAKHIAVFDTSFHQTMPHVAYHYAIPQELNKKHTIRRYGFHGISHSFVIKETIKKLQNKNAKIISCHFGNGSSITAYHKKVLDTSMGFGPLEGIPMGTRSGTIDPTIIFYLSETLKLSISKIKEILNKQSGLLALSKLSSDMRLIHQAADNKNPDAQFAIEYLAYRSAQQIAAYIAILNGVDAITFTAGIGQYAYYLRTEIFKHLKIFNLKLSPTANKLCKDIISHQDSKAKIFVIPTNEELEIARVSFNLR